MRTEQPDDTNVEQLVDDFARRWRAGERPSIDDYTEKYPQWADEIRDVFPAVQMMEDLKPRREDSTPTAKIAFGNAAPPERIGEFHIVREIGRGGMGVVYEAFQESLGRRVALKVLPAHLLSNENLRARFHRESHAAAKLHHTNIVPVFGVGEELGLCFYVMQLISGRGLDLVARNQGSGVTSQESDTGLGQSNPDTCPLTPDPCLLTPEMVARIGAQVADALAYAHSQGVLHRDVKPSNLLLDERGSVWVTDFGVAKLVEEAHLTQSGDLVGTLRYMPPERFNGVSDARGDVYSLGITLYELLARKSAFPNTTPQHVIALITQGGLPRLRKLNPEVPADLETIVLKAISREPERRYQSAAALGDDLRRFLDDRPILARRIGPVERAWRWCRRNPISATSIGTAFLLMIAVTVVSVAAYIRTSAAQRETETANQDMRKALDAEQAQREHAEATSALALEALARTYDRFAPTRLVVTPPTTTEEGADLPIQPVLPPEAILLLEELLRTYEKIAQASREFPRLQGQAAEANHRIGDIRQRLGRFDDAIAAYRTAIDIYSGLPTDSPDEAVRIKLARSYNELGRVLRLVQKAEEAGKMHAVAVKILREAPQPLADRPEFRYELARAYYTLGQQELFLGPPGFGGGQGPKGPPKFGPGEGGFPKGPESRDPFPIQQSIAILEDLTREHPKVPEYRHLLACCYRDAPPGRFSPGPPAEGKPDRAIELLRDLVREYPRVPDYRFDLCETLRRPMRPFGPGSMSKGRIREAVEIADGLVAQYPNVPLYAAAQAQSHDLLGFALFAERDLPAAVEAHRTAVKLQSELAKQYPDVTAYQFWLSLMERSLARVLAERDDLKEARTRLESAIARLELLRQNDPRSGSTRFWLGEMYRELAGVLRRGGEIILAAQAVRKADEFGPDSGGPMSPFGPRPGGKKP
jgi:eukaryotic-like serine/threonine-protein kinase